METVSSELSEDPLKGGPNSVVDMGRIEFVSKEDERSLWWVSINASFDGILHLHAKPLLCHLVLTIHPIWGG